MITLYFYILPPVNYMLITRNMYTYVVLKLEAIIFNGSGDSKTITVIPYC